ncbi:hypothetical protein ACMC9M_08500 [Pseudomonadota bacterium 24LQ007]
MSFRFTSYQDFRQTTFDLSRHLKPIKLGKLRDAIAKSAGFDSVMSYQAHLDQQEFLAQREIEYEWQRPPHDPCKSIQRKGRHLIIERSIWRPRQDFDSLECWREDVRLLFSAPRLNGLSERIVNNKVYVCGHINLEEEPSFDSVTKVLRSFWYEEGDTGCARYTLFDKIFSGISLIFHQAADIPVTQDYPLRAPALSDGLRQEYEKTRAQQKALPALSDFQEVVETLPKYLFDFIPLTDFDLAVAKTVFKCKDVSQAKNELCERAQKLFETAINEILSCHCVGNPQNSSEFFLPVGEVFDFDGASEILEAAFYLNATISRDEEGWNQIDLKHD